MSNPPAVYSDDQVRQRLAGQLSNWWLESGMIQRRFACNGWKSSLLIANAVGHLAEAAWHHPELHVAFSSVHITLSTHSVNGITDLDFELAQQIEAFVLWRPVHGSGTPNTDRHRYLVYDE